MTNDNFRKAFLLLLVAAISIVFVAMIHQFVLALFLAAIFAGLLHPLYQRTTRLFRGRRVLAALTTLLLFLVVIVGPLLTFLGVVASEAFRISESVTPWVQQQLQRPDPLGGLFEHVPGAERLEPYRGTILTKMGQLIGSAGNYLFDMLSRTTRGTVTFFFQFFLMLYSMFFFLLDGSLILKRILYYMPLPHDDEARMLSKFVSVTRATLKGSLLIGIAQGALGGVAFVVVGLEGALFWGTVMAILSVIPGIGPALVWVPAALFLFVTDAIGRGVFLTLFCVLVVGTIDNFLRPRLVGRDVKMHDLLILFGTLGGLYLFGFAGFIIGPIVVAVFVTVWDIYGVVFKQVLPEVGDLGSARDKPR